MPCHRPAMRLSLSLSFLLLLPAHALAEPSIIKLYTEELPPYNTLLPDGRIGGSATQKVEAILKDAKLSHTLELTSWARAFGLARIQANSCVYSTARTPEREAQFKWIGELARIDGVLFALADRPRNSPATMEAAMGTRIGGYHSSASALYMVKKGYNVIMSANHDISLKNLLAGRLDFWLASRTTGQLLIDKQGVNGKVVPVIPVLNLELYLACNAAMEPAQIQRLQQSFAQLQADGTLAAIDRQFRE
ncbi:amino acid ABC transporter substrate-binding protein [Chitinimonas arctica]|uniref:Amino acid ABC transporter substrate-binding protein n=1 Tax=Chitinimonas arctica TaxID=2594795 RepID=A0A516SJ40_9NEIS|nr:transporter substrate-binding domain-containing protein [Chitinimonas arctica]QDQ28164.1 amino acid ABC transporter substrate-binding protein [Chitinimonas arctica]